MQQQNSSEHVTNPPAMKYDEIFCMEAQKTSCVYIVASYDAHVASWDVCTIDWHHDWPYAISHDFHVILYSTILLDPCKCCAIFMLIHNISASIINFLKKFAWNGILWCRLPMGPILEPSLWVGTMRAIPCKGKQQCRRSEWVWQLSRSAGDRISYNES